MTQINILSGLSGAGKTAASESLEAHYNDNGTFCTSEELSDYVRFCYESAVSNGGIDDNELGEWAAKQKERHGNGYFAEGLSTEIKTPFPEADVVNVIGVRSPEEADVIREWFDDVRIITIWAAPDERYQRLVDREDGYSYDTFHERKDRELWDWGCIEFFTNDDYYDHIVPNNHDLDALDNAMKNIVNGTNIYTEPPFPEGLSKEHLGAYL